MNSILIIEDNEQDQKILRRYLSKAGFASIVFASSGEEGLEVFQSERPAIVVTDTNLPGMDGFETCRRIKEAGGEAVRVIVTTGAIDAVDAGRARSMGADDYCVKTSDCLPLISALKNLTNEGA